jgi:hypothetical protein
MGSWAGDRIALIGDYTRAEDLAPEHRADTIAARSCSDKELRAVARDARRNLADMERDGDADQDAIERARDWAERAGEHERMGAYRDITSAVRKVLARELPITYAQRDGVIIRRQKAGHAPLFW